MHHFFVDPGQVDGENVTVLGEDVNHIRNVLRVQPGEELLISDGAGNDYLCRTEELARDCVRLRILERREESAELPSRIWLFQGLPKSDKMELIIQKAVELGAAGIVPVATKNAVVKLEGKKAQAKVARWQAIAESAAKQSKRSVLPRVERVMSLKEAFAFAREQELSLAMIPYENEEGTEGTRRAFAEVVPGRGIAVFIGPEGGFDPAEIALARENGALPVSLGKRILRTETAGLAVLAALMLRLEGAL